MDELEKLLGNERYDAVKRKTGEKGLTTDNGMLIPKHRFDCVNISLKEHKKTVAEQREQILALQNEVEKLRSFERQCAELSEEIMILQEIGKSGAKNVISVRALIENSGRHGDRLKASVKRQIRKLEKTADYLFYHPNQTLMPNVYRSACKLEKENE